MQHSVRVAPLNSLIFVSDPDGGVPPIPVWGATILATPTCISVACFPEIDGETEITLGALDEVDQRTIPEFTGTLRTPHFSIMVWTVDDQKLLQLSVAKQENEVKIWRSHPRWPEKVTIGVG